MKLSSEERALITQFAAVFPLPTTEDGSRTWTRQLCEQLAFTFPYDVSGHAWGHKAQGEAYPPSKDCIAQQEPFIGWDIITSAGSPQAALSLDGDAYDLTGQWFIEVKPTNHLGIDPDPPDPPEPPTDLESRVQALEVAARQIAAILGQI